MPTAPDAPAPTAVADEMAAIVADFRSWHKRYTDSEYEEGTGRLMEWEGCEGCDHESWPCPTIALCDAYDAQVATLAARDAATGAVIDAARQLDDAWHRGGVLDAHHRDLCDALDAYWLAPMEARAGAARRAEEEGGDGNVVTGS